MIVTKQVGNVTVTIEGKPEEIARYEEIKNITDDSKGNKTINNKYLNVNERSPIIKFLESLQLKLEKENHGSF